MAVHSWALPCGGGYASCFATGDVLIELAVGSEHHVSPRITVRADTLSWSQLPDLPGTGVDCQALVDAIVWCVVFLWASTYSSYTRTCTYLALLGVGGIRVGASKTATRSLSLLCCDTFEFAEAEGRWY